MLSCADDNPLANAQLPRANKAPATTANATARRSRIGISLPAVSAAQPVAHAPGRLDVVPPERHVDLPPQVLHILVDDVGPAVIGEIPQLLDDLRPGQHFPRMAEEQLQ